MVRPFCPSSAKKPGYAGECAVAPDDAGGTDALGAAAGAEAGRAAVDGVAGGIGAVGEAGIAAGAAAGDFAGGVAPAGFSGAAAAAGLASGAAATGLAAGAAAGDVFGADSDVAAAGLRNPAGMGIGGGAAIPKMVFPAARLSINFPVVGQVRVSGRCCFSQWGQVFTGQPHGRVQGMQGLRG